MSEASDQVAGSDLEAEIARIEARLREIRAELGRGKEIDHAPVDALLEEERHLLLRLQEISDRFAGENMGLAEQLVKHEGARPEELPDLPSATSESE